MNEDKRDRDVTKTGFGHRAGGHHFTEQHHHPIVHMAQHVISPLTASLFIFGVHKMAQAPAFRASLRAAACLARGRMARFTRRGAAPVTTAVATTSTVAAVDSSSTHITHSIDRLHEIYAPEDVPLVFEHITTWWSVKQVESLLHWVHMSTSLPWWATIAGVTLGLRTLLAFVNIDLLRNSLRMKLIAPQVAQLERELIAATTQEDKCDAAKRLRQVFIDGKCSPWKQTLTFPFLLPPTILSIFGAIHNISMTEPSMATQGLWWFPDLIATDTTFLLPTISALTWLWNVEMGAGVYYHAWPTPKVLARALAVASIPLTANMPAGVFVFWVTSNLFAVARTYVMRTDVARRFFRIPLQREVAALAHLPKPMQ